MTPRDEKSVVRFFCWPRSWPAPRGTRTFARMRQQMKTCFTLRCVCFGVRTREKSAGFRIAITLLSLLRWIFIGPTRRIFSLFFFRLGKTRKAQNEATRREKDFTFYTWKEGDKINTTQTHKKEREKKKNWTHEFRVFEMCVWKKQTRQRREKKNTRTKVSSSSSSHRFRL